MKKTMFLLCDEIFLARLQGKFEIEHSWEWKGWYSTVKWEQLPHLCVFTETCMSSFDNQPSWNVYSERENMKAKANHFEFIIHNCMLLVLNTCSRCCPLLLFIHSHVGWGTGPPWSLRTPAGIPRGKIVGCADHGKGNIWRALSKRGVCSYFIAKSCWIGAGSDPAIKLFCVHVLHIWKLKSTNSSKQ